MDEPPDSLTIEIVATLDDQLAFQRFLLRRPPLARMRLRREALIVAFAPVALLIGILFGWAIDPDRTALGPLFRDLLFSHPAQTVRYVIGAVVLMAGFILVGRLLTPSRLRTVTRQALRARSDVDSALAQTTVATFDAEGITSETASGHSLVRWSAINDVAETPGYLYYVIGFATGLFVPKRVMSAEQTDLLRDLIARYCGSSESRRPGEGGRLGLGSTSPRRNHSRQ